MEALVSLSQGKADREDYRGLSYDPRAFCFAANLIFSLSLSGSPWRRGEHEVRESVQGAMVVLWWSLLQSGPQTTGRRPAEAGASSQNLRWVSLYAALQCSSVNRPNDAIGDSRSKTRIRCRECGDWVPGRIVSAAILQLGNGWRIGTFVGHRNVTKHSWLSAPLAGVLSLLSPPASPRVAVLVQLATLCKLRQSYQCAGRYRAHQTSVPDQAEQKCSFSETPSRFEIYKHSLTRTRGSEQNEFQWRELSCNFEEKKISQIIAVIRHKLKEWFSRIITAERKWSCGHQGSRQWTTRREIEFWLSLVSQRFLKLQIIMARKYSKIQGKVFYFQTQ